jgi:hypothetical protein
VWDLVVICWNGVLIVCATVLAFQSRTIKQEFNDSQSLGTMIYSHFVFAVLRAVTFNLGGSDSTDDGVTVGTIPTIAPATIAAASSFLLSIDVITAVSIYIIPKIEAARKAPGAHTHQNSDQSEMQNSMYYSKTPDGAHSTAARTNGAPAMAGTTTSRSNRTGSGSSGKPRGWARSGHSMPSIDEVSDDHEDDDSKEHELSLKSGSSHRRIGMDGHVVPTDDEDGGDTSSSDEMDHGGPRFAPPPSAVEAPATETAAPSLQ